MFGRGLGYGALATVLPACGGGGGSGSDDDAVPVATANLSPIPKPQVPEYSALKRTSFGPHRDAAGVDTNPRHR